MTIDGKRKDWTGQILHSNNSSGILYGISNDRDNLYMIFELPEQQTQMKMLSAGFELSIQVKADTKVDASILFPTMKIGMEKSRERNRQSKPTVDKKLYLMQATHAEAFGFLHTNDVIARSSSPEESFCFNIGWNEFQGMVIEIKIPFAELFEHPEQFDDVLKSKIKILPLLNAMERPAMASQNSRPGGMDSSGMGPGGGESGGMGRGGSGGGGGGGGGQGRGGMRPGGGGGGGKGPGSSDNQSSFGEQKFSFKITLNDATD